MRLGPRNPVIAVVSIFMFFVGLFLFLLGFGGNVFVLAIGAVILIAGVSLLIWVLSSQSPEAPAS